VVRITRCVAIALAVGLPMPAVAVECTVAIQPPLLAAQARDGHRDRAIYGWQLMTHDERANFLARLREARTPAERATLHRLNHDAMVARAAERGVQLPAGPDGARADAGRRVEPTLLRRCPSSAR